MAGQGTLLEKRESGNPHALREKNAGVLGFNLQEDSKKEGETRQAALECCVSHEGSGTERKETRVARKHEASKSNPSTALGLPWLSLGRA